jgi:hypothetical protein
LEGGKTEVKILIDSTATGTTFSMNAIRFELVDGKGNGDEVNIWGADDDLEEVTGTVARTLVIDTGARFNHFHSHSSTGDANNDEDLWRRYFSGGTYLVKLVYGQVSTGADAVDYFLDGDSANPFLDAINMDGAAVENLEVFTTVNIPRGFHDVHEKCISAGADFRPKTQLLQFTKIGENPDPENDDNSDGVHGSIVPLARHIARVAESSHTFKLFPIDPKKYSKIILEWSLEATASLSLELKLNAITSAYYISGNSNIGTTTANIDDPNTSEWILADSSLILDIASREASGKVELFVRNLSPINFIYGISEAVGATRGSELRGLSTNIGTPKIEDIILETSTSTWKIGSRFNVYGIKEKLT